MNDLFVVYKRIKTYAQQNITESSEDLLWNGWL